MSTTYAIFRKGLAPLKIQNLAGGLKTYQKGMIIR